MEVIEDCINKKDIYIVNKLDLKAISKTGIIKECNDYENSGHKVLVIKDYNPILEKTEVKVLVIKNLETNKLSDVIEKINDLIMNHQTENSEYKLGKLTIDEYLKKKYEMIKKREALDLYLNKLELEVENEKTKEDIVNKIIEEIYNTSVKNIVSDEEKSKETAYQDAENSENLEDIEEIEDTENIDEIIKTIIGASRNNDILIISEKQNKIYLPYTIDELENYLRSYPSEYLTLEKVVEDEFIIPFNSFYKNPSHTRFSEAYNLIKNRERKSSFSAFMYAINVAGNQKLNPAVIAACKTKKELSAYMNCLKRNNLDEFDYFDIIYESKTA
jgi:hypothetical protein